MRLPTSLVVIGLLPALPAMALDLPARRAGLWEIQIQGVGNLPAMTAQHCIDAKTDREMNALGSGMAQQQCSQQDVQQSGGTITVDSVCKIGSGTMITHAVITGDFNKAYTVRVTSKRDGGDNTKSAANGTLTIEAKWLGACRPDQRPGDIVMGGRTMNILDLKKGAGGQRPPGARP